VAELKPRDNLQGHQLLFGRVPPSRFYREGGTGLSLLSFFLQRNGKAKKRIIRSIPRAGIVQNWGIRETHSLCSE